MQTRLAAVILAHRDPGQVHRLIRALGEIPIYLHCDGRTPDAVAGRMLSGLPANVRTVPRRKTSLASWSLVQAELDALRLALAEGGADHIVVMSGADYPLAPIDDIATELAQGWSGRSYLWNAPIPYAPWDTPRHRDGGRWRFEHRFLSHRDRLIYLRGIPLRLPWRRRIPAELELRASTQWKIYAAEDARRLLSVADAQPGLIDFWRSTLIPEESFAASVLGSGALFGASALRPCRADAWLIRWDAANTDHPAWLGSADFDDLVAAAAAEPVSADIAFAPHGEKSGVMHQKWFARKFSSEFSGNLLDRVDHEILTRGPLIR